MIDEGKVYDEDGFFVLDTDVLGNKNTGHEFSAAFNGANSPKGVIGSQITDSECDALLEYLKTQ